MPTECSPLLFEFAPVGGRAVVAAFDGGAITSDAGGLLLGSADDAVRLTERFAACFHDARNRYLIEHEVVTLVGQRVFGIALGYEDLNDHDQLRHDPVYGTQEGRFFHGYYDCYCYLPLYIFCGRHLLAARLRAANRGGAAGALEEVARIVRHIRQVFR